ncbi:unnamed protein product [Ilex paraguariensis]|uniref:CHCH domain-containing protein n=1 Tax=Ilex paraguariensis TaxID=185542 RepID=A0ABC8SY90_9AQUA
MSPLRKIALFTIASSSPDEEAIGRDGEHGGRGRRADPDVGGADGGVEAHSDEMQKDDPNPEKCLDKGHQVTRCVLRLLKDLHQRCTKEMDAYAACLYDHTNEFELCRKEQKEFEKACPLE